MVFLFLSKKGFLNSLKKFLFLERFKNLGLKIFLHSLDLNFFFIKEISKSAKDKKISKIFLKKL